MRRELQAPFLFVSYASCDWNSYVRPLVECLSSRGYTLWFDRQSLVAGADYEREIVRGLTRCGAVLWVVSRQALDPAHRWVIAEVREARRLFAPVIPIVVEACDLPEELTELHWTRMIPPGFDASAHATYRELDFARLVAAIDHTLHVKGNRLVDRTPSAVQTRAMVGRETEMGKVVSQMRHGGRLWLPEQPSGLVAVQAMPGLGKTMLVEEIVRRIGARYPGGVILECGGARAQKVDAVLRRWARYAGVDGSKRDLTPEEVRDFFELAMVGELLVVFDDVWLRDVDGVRSLARALPAECDCVLTTRFPAVARTLTTKVYELGAFRRADGLAFLASRLKHRLVGAIPEKLLVRMWELVRGHPLALELAAGRCEHADPSRLTEGLNSLESRLEHGDISPFARSSAAGRESLAASLDETLEVLREHELAGKFVDLGVFAPEAPFDDEAAAALWDEDPYEAAETLNELVRYGALQTKAQGCWSLHALLQCYARGLLKQNRQRFREASACHAEHYRKLAGDFRPRRWRATERHAANIAYAADRVCRNYEEEQIRGGQASQETVTQALEMALSSYRYLRLRRVHKGLHWLFSGLAAARQLGDVRAEALILSELGLWHNQRGQRRQALQYFRQALPLWQELWRQTRERICRRPELGKDLKLLRSESYGLTMTLGNIGVVYRAVDRPLKALEYYRESLDILREVGDRRSQVITLDNMGVAYRDLGLHEEALKYYRRAEDARGEIPPEERRPDPVLLNNMGRAYRDLGRYREALDCLQRALELDEAEGNDTGRAIVFNNLGNVYFDQREFALALDYYERAVPLREAIGDAPRLAVSHHNLGSFHEKQGHPRRALEHFEKALALEERVADFAGRASTLLRLAILVHAHPELGRSEEATWILAQAVDVLRKRRLDHTSSGKRVEALERLLARWT